MSQMIYTSEGNNVVATHKPSGESEVAGIAATPEDAAKAAAIINRGMKLNHDRKYTAAAREYAKLDLIPGYRDLT